MEEETQAVSEVAVEKVVETDSNAGAVKELLNPAASEKEASAEELLSHKKTVAEVNDSHAKSSQLLREYESRNLEVQSQSQEAMVRHTEKESEANDLNQKLQALESQVNCYKGQAQEAVATSETHKMRLDESLQKIKHLETVVEELQNELLHESEQNMKSLQELTKKLATCRGNVELEKFMQVSNSAAEDAKTELREMEARWKAAMQKNVDLKQKLMRVKGSMRRTEEAIKYLGMMVTPAGQEKNLLSSQMEKVSQLETNLNQSFLRSSQLEEELKIAKNKCKEHEDQASMINQRSCELQSLLAQALSDNAELQQKLKSLEELHKESETTAATASQRNVELEDFIQASNSAAEGAKSQLREVKARLIVAEPKNVELEQQINQVQPETSCGEREVADFLVTISQRNAKLTEAEEEKKLLCSQMQDYLEKVSRLESDLNQSSLRSSKLEEELKIAKGKCTEHEDQASMNHQRCRELEGLYQTYHSKFEDANKQVSELELLLEEGKHRIQELKQQISTLEQRCRNSEADAKNHRDKVSNLTAELEACQARASSLELALQTASEKKRLLKESLTAVTDEKKKLEDALNGLHEKLAETKNILEDSQPTLTYSRKKPKVQG